jgi:hypothetical protein
MPARQAARGRAAGTPPGRYPRRMPSRPTRRSVLAAALAVPVASAAGCTLSGPPSREGATGRSPEVDPDVALLEEVSRATSEVVALYEGVIEQHRSLRGDLRPLLVAHREHVQALGQAAPPEEAGNDRTRRGSATAQTPHVPRRPGQAVRRLQSTERDTSDRLLEATRQAQSGGFARLLASMSASSAQAGHVLGELSEAGGG